MRIKKSLKIALVLLLVNITACVFASEVKFAQLTDVHLNNKSENRGGRMLKQSENLLLDAVKQINAVDGIDFVIFTGDTIDYPSKKLFEPLKPIVNELKPQWYWTIGNHDVGPGLNKQQFISSMNEINKFNRAKPYYSFIIDDFIFICMDGTIEMIPSAHGVFSEEELEWLDKQLEDNQDKYAVIFQHFPIVEPFKSSDHYILNADKYLEVLDKHNNVAAVITGHYHASKITERNNVLHVSSPALVQYPNAFRIITMTTTDDGIKFDFKFMQTTLEEVKNQSLQETKSYKLNYGSENSRNTTILLKKK